MLVQASRVLLRQILLQRLGLLPYGVQYASLAPDPPFIPCAEDSVEETMRDLLRRQRPVRPGPAHILMHGAAEAFLRYANLQRAEARFRAHPARHHLVDRGTARAASGKTRTRHQPAHRGRMAVERSVDNGGV